MSTISPDFRALNSAITLAIKAHDGQFDKAGLPYILHPLRVMNAVILKTKDLEVGAAAVLHDVVEDTTWCDCNYLRLLGFSDRIVGLVNAVTRYKVSETYEDFIQRLYEYGTTVDYAAIQIKREDIADNTSPNRLDHLPKHEAEYLVRKYTKALNVLNK